MDIGLVGITWLALAAMGMVAAYAADRHRYHRDRELVMRACARLTKKRLSLKGDASAGAAWAMAEIAAAVDDEPSFLGQCRKDVGLK